MADQTPADPQQEALFREVDEELRHEQMTRLWKRYGSLITTIAVLVVAVVAGYQGWKAYSAHLRQQDAVAYEQAVQNMAQAPLDTAEALKAVAQEAQPGTATLAQMQRASLLAQNGKAAEALEAYKAIMDNADTDPVLKDMATLRYALLGMDNGVSTDTLAGLVQPLAAPAQPLTYSAMQIQALLALKDGRTDEAKTILQGMIDSTDCPPGLRTRASSMLEQIAFTPVTEDVVMVPETAQPVEQPQAGAAPAEAAPESAPESTPAAAGEAGPADASQN